jgi:hypothetical protein
MVETIWLVYLGVSPFILATLIIYKLGGPLEAYYRLSRIPYFAMVVFGPDGSEGFALLRYELIQKRSPPSFSYNGKMREIDDANHGYHHGRPKWYFNYDDFHALPILHWNEKKRIDPSHLDAAWNDKFLEELARLGQKVPPLVTLLIIILAVSLVASIIGIASIYYSHNAYCAIAPRNC